MVTFDQPYNATIIMKSFRFAVIIVFLLAVIQGCRQGNVITSEELLNDKGLINAEFYLKKDTINYFWNIREIPGRGTLIIQEGIVGNDIRSYEIHEDSVTNLEKHAAKLHAEKRAEGYRIYKPEEYSHIIIQLESFTLDSDTMNLSEPNQPNNTNDIDRFVLIEELINQSLVNTGNGRCTGSNYETGISYFAVVFDPEIAARTILRMITAKNLNIKVIIAVEKGSDIRVIYPEDFQGNFSLI